MLPQNPMQLKPAYHARLDPKFLAWYLPTFDNTRRHYGHWSVGCYDQDFPEYQEMVEDGKTTGFSSEVHKHDDVAHLVRNNSPAEDTFAHTYHRNTNAWATCFASMSGGSTDDLGPNAPTPDEIDVFVRAMVEDHINLHVPIGNFMGHGEAADNMDFPTRNDPAAPHDPYGPSTTCERWDLGCWIDPQTRALLPFTRPCPAGWEFLPDYIRGQAIIGIQDATRAKWAAAA